MLGLERGTVRLHEHDQCWAESAKEAILDLLGILGKDAIAAEHIGSTSIPGIKAKPIIDIAVGVEDFSSVIKKEADLYARGFMHVCENDEDWQVFLFCGNEESGLVTHHIHIVRYDGKEWNDYLAFRDRLRIHREEALAYENLKDDLMGRYGNDRNSYTAAKAEFILDILKKCRTNKPTDKVKPVK